MLDDLQRALRDRGLRYVRIDGSCSSEQRRTVINSFQSEPDLRVMLLSIGCGSEGQVEIQQDVRPPTNFW